MNHLQTKTKIVLLVIIALTIAALACLFFDSHLSRAALQYSQQARDETNVLGELFQLTRIFGKADTLILLGLLLGLAGKRKLLLKLLFSLLFVAILVHPVKHIVGRERPDGSAQVSFPSGDTATAFVMPEVFAGNLPLSIASAAAATMAGTSRVFYAQHYPGDVLMGAALGLIAGLAGAWLTKKIRWLPSIKLISYLTLAFLLIQLINAIANGHHRHIVQFIAWFGPALCLYICHIRLRIFHGKRLKITSSRNVISGPLFSLLEHAFIFCGILGGVLLIIPWFTEAPGMRAPAISGGILLIVFAVISLKSLRTRRIGSILADSAVFFYIVPIFSAGYLLGIL